MPLSIPLLKERNETSKVETGLSADWVYFAPFQTDTQVTVLLCWALSDLKTPILFLLSFRLNTALHYALLALLSLSTLVFRNNMCHCLSVWDVLIARWAVDISQFSNHSELHWWDLKGRNRTVCRLSLYIIYYIFFPLPLFVCVYRFSTRCILTICNLSPDFPFVKLHSKWPPV